MKRTVSLLIGLTLAAALAAAFWFFTRTSGGAGDYVTAQFISAQAFHRYHDGRVRHFSCRMYDEGAEKWAFHYDNLDDPRPGSDLIVVVNKRTGAVQLYPGL